MMPEKTTKSSRVAEYLGQRVDVDMSIVPIPYPFTQPIALCPFMNLPCSKMKMKTNSKFPICSLRVNGELYIICEHRLASTSMQQKSIIAPYQIKMLHMLAQEVFHPQITFDEVAFKAEVTMKSGSKADYMISLVPGARNVIGPTRLIVEMQGGGETNNTGIMTDLLKAWTNSSQPNNVALSTPMPKVHPIENNAWKRLQEQILAKASVSTITSSEYGFVACVGTRVFDHVSKTLQGLTRLQVPQDEWNVALIAFSEDTSYPLSTNPIPLKVDQQRKLFTTYARLADALVNRGVEDSAAFQGTYTTLSGNLVNLR